MLFTIAFIYQLQVLLKLHRHMVHRSKASNLLVFINALLTVDSVNIL
jgi:hypothetical protein